MEKREKARGKEPIPYMLPDMNKKDMRRYIVLDRDLAIYGHRLLIGILHLRTLTMTTLTCKQLFPWQKKKKKLNKTIVFVEEKKWGNSGHLGCFQTCRTFASCVPISEMEKSDVKSYGAQYLLSFKLFSHKNELYVQIK